MQWVRSLWGLRPAAAKPPVPFALSGPPQMAGDQLPPSLLEREPEAEPDQLAWPLGTGKAGVWDSNIWPLSWEGQLEEAPEEDRGEGAMWP